MFWDSALSTGPHDRVGSNVERTRIAQEQMAMQMGQLLHVNIAQLQVQHQQLSIQQDQLAVQHEQLRVQDDIRQIGEQQLAVNEEQLLQAIRTVGRIDLTNHRLSQIDNALGDMSGILVEQNALIQKSLNRLGTEAQELIVRAEDAFNNGWYDDAAIDFGKALEKVPYSPIAHYYRAKCYAQAGQMDEAQREYEKCIY